MKDLINPGLLILDYTLIFNKPKFNLPIFASCVADEL
jgi:hypothetical protein